MNTLGYPKAALFAFCVGLVSYNLMSVIKGVRSRQCQGFPRNPGRFHPGSGLKSLDQLGAIEREASFL